MMKWAESLQDLNSLQYIVFVSQYKWYCQVQFQWEQNSLVDIDMKFMAIFGF